MKTNLTIIFILIFVKAFTQSFEINYTYTNSKGSKKVYVLEINDSISSFVEKEYVNQNEDIVSENKSNYTFYKVKSKKTIYYTDRVFKNTLLVQDSINIQKWTLTDDMKFILGLKCKSAITKFRGRNYIAYYFPNYKISDGPWKFSGLPGIILEVKSSDGDYSYKATLIREINNKINFQENFLDNVFLNWEQYKIEFKKLMDNIVNKLKIQDNSEGGGYFKFDKPEIIYPEIQSDMGIKF